ncbi:MAG: CotH kinase family protein [Ruminococcus sp.]|nr:CotH kinase family protein [Ruminococcus sp.]
MKHKSIVNALLILSLCCTLTSCSDKNSGPAPSSETAETTDPSKEPTTAAEAPFEAEGMRFSVKSGFYDAPFDLEISAAEGTEIYYTLDGSIPTSDSTRYDSPIAVSDRSDEENKLSTQRGIAQPVSDLDAFVPTKKTDKATVVRAVAVDKNGIQSSVVSCTYFVGFGDKAEYYKDVKIVSMMTDEADLFDYEKGIYALGKVYDDWKNGDGFDPETPEWFMPANYTQHGREWEREATLQFFEGGQLAHEQKVGIRIHGGATRSYPQKSFNVYARKEYGAGKLKYDLFSGNVKCKSDGSTVTEFDSFVLRNGGNDAQYTRFRDKLIQSLVSDRAFLTQGMEPCILFIDGEFWGHYELTEKLDNDFISTHYGVPAKDICIIKKEALEDGSEETFTEWEHLREWILATDFSEQPEYDELCKRVDIQSFMDYVSTELYINNSDWRRGNTAYWKAETVDESNPYADGKWRFLLFDTEYSSGLYGEALPSDNNIETFIGNECFITDLFNAAMENEGFREQFRETFRDIADNNFASGKVDAEIDRLSKEYKEMTVATYNRFWHGWYGGSAAESNYLDAVYDLKSFFDKRHDYITKYLDEMYK